ncbi:hypothetical protein L292_0423 [Acinetobacter junii CIP 107470 = MTCC 11364]|uniref:Uncharacterized protein n=1 Tax=Acinetobacter junii CIP 107470 = MTCC 11364 TaxID=1217666 RepID=S7Y6Z0_ACIJU|nr:hypothetical protein L292_0423 [Acinetobacter junii CIP 107470 = MTCC 11364]
MPNDFYSAVEQRQVHIKTTQKGMIENGASDLSLGSNFMTLTKQIQPKSTVIYHSIIGNATSSNSIEQSTDVIVPYRSSHLNGASSEMVIHGGHSIQETPEAVLEIRRILRLHIKDIK